MNTAAPISSDSVVALLRRISRPRPREERCDFCNADIPPAHRHLLEMDNRKIVCTCDACAMRFQDAVGGRFKLIPRDVRSLPDFKMTDAQWESFALPINLTFFYRATPAGRVVAMYPSPAGATESLLPTESWAALESDNPALMEMKPDVEALLVNRIRNVRQYFIAPMDVCYALTGLIRTHWKGLSGGDDVWKEIDKFFGELRAREIVCA